jgi:hypothetical protein
LLKFERIKIHRQCLYPQTTKNLEIIQQKASRTNRKDQSSLKVVQDQSQPALQKKLGLPELIVEANQE